MQFLISKCGYKLSPELASVITMNKFISIVFLVLCSLYPGTIASRVVPETVAEEALTVAKEPLAGDATRHEDLAEASGCTWTWVNPCTGISSCYHLIEQPQDFFAAELQCVLQHQGHLAVVTTLGESTFLRTKLLEHHVTVPIWVGAFRVDNVWSWTSGDIYDFTDWKPGQPNETGDACVNLAAGSFFLWADFDCAHATHFLCESFNINTKP